MFKDNMEESTLSTTLHDIKKRQKISILGCGWIGKALAKKIEKKSSVKASVQSKSSLDRLNIKDKTILNTYNNFDAPNFYKSDTLIISLPPREAYLENLKTIFTHIQAHTQVILLSSTSVYNQTQGQVKEDDTDNITNPSLMLKAERLVQEIYPSILILRLGGLMGYNRIAGKYTAGKTLESNASVNYVHRNDVVDVIIKCIEKKIESNLFNVVAPLKATKKEIYDYNAKRYGFEKTFFKTLNIKGKTVSSEKLIHQLPYSFKQIAVESICMGNLLYD